MKGISNIISIILILLIVVSLASLVYLFFGDVFRGLTQVGGNETEKLTTTLSSSFIIDSSTDNQIFIRNNGQTNLSKFFVTLNGFPLNFTIDKAVLPKGEIATITFSSYIGKETGNKVKITTAEGASLEKDFGIVFYDDFNNWNSNGWNVLSGNWFVGSLRGNPAYTGGNPTLNENSFVVLNQTKSMTYEFAYEMGGMDWFKFYLYSDLPTRNNSYSIVMGSGPTVGIYKSINGVEQLKATFATGVMGIMKFHIEYDVSKGGITIFVNGINVGNWTDSDPIKQGSYISLATMGGHFDNIKVKLL
jgi:hypothetical protein